LVGLFVNSLKRTESENESGELNAQCRTDQFPFSETLASNFIKQLVPGVVVAFLIFFFFLKKIKRSVDRFKGILLESRQELCCSGRLDRSTVFDTKKSVVFS